MIKKNILIVIFACILSTVTYATTDTTGSHLNTPKFSVPDYATLALDEHIMSLLDRHVLPIKSKTKRLNALHKLLYSEEHLNIQYMGSSTKTAIETFYAGNGNCVSLANLFIAAARHVGLDARYQSVKTEREWRRKAGYYEVLGHINVIVFLPARKQAEIEFDQTFLENTDKATLKRKIISDKQALAEFYNNLGVESFNEEDTSKATSYFEKSISTYSRLDFSWSNLGVAYKKQKKYALAESAYLRALKINPKNHSSISNLFKLYTLTGELEKSKKYAKRAQKYARENPYQLENEAQDSIDNADYKKAKSLLNKAIKKMANEPSFYHKLGIVHYHLNNKNKAIKALQKARKLSSSMELAQRYDKKIRTLTN